MGNTVLIVESCEEYREYLNLFFIQREFEVTACSSYESAQRTLVSKKFDVVITDFYCNEEDGGSFCSLLSGSNETGLIIMSERQSSDLEQRIRIIAPAFYFVKPFSVENLYAVVLKICEFSNKKTLAKNRIGIAVYQ